MGLTRKMADAGFPGHKRTAERLRRVAIRSDKGCRKRMAMRDRKFAN